MYQKLDFRQEVNIWHAMAAYKLHTVYFATDLTWHPKGRERVNQMLQTVNLYMLCFVIAFSLSHSCSGRKNWKNLGKQNGHQSSPRILIQVSTVTSSVKRTTTLKMVTYEFMQVSCELMIVCVCVCVCVCMCVCVCLCVCVCVCMRVCMCERDVCVYMSMIVQQGFFTRNIN